MVGVAAARSRALLLPGAAAALSSSAPSFYSRAAPSSSYHRAAPSSSSYAYRAEVAAAAAAAGGEAPPYYYHRAAPSSSSYAYRAEVAAAAAAAGGEAAQHPLPARKRWVGGLLKFGFLATLVGAVGGTGYATHAYSLAEVDHNTHEFRKEMTTPIPVPADATQLEKFQARAYETVMKAPVVSIEYYLELRGRIEDHILGIEKLLPDLDEQEQPIFTLVLDLNDTLVYSDWKPDSKVFMRPGVETFLQHISTMYEVVVYSDQLEIDVEHAVKMIDKTGRVYTLSRPATKYRKGTHFRDLSKLNRNPARVLYMSAHALESCLQPENCLTIKSWTPETDDTELLDLIPFLEYFAVFNPSDIREVVAVYQGHDIVQMFYEECKEIERVQKSLEERKSKSKFWWWPWSWPF